MDSTDRLAPETHRNAPRQAVALALLAGAGLLLGGCGLFQGWFGQPKPAPMGVSVAGPYAGLKDKSVAIVVYVPPATLNEYAGAREEISSFIANQMRLNMPTTRLLDPREVIAWQNSTINWYGLPEQEIGKHFSVDRVLFVQVLDYSLRRSIGYSDLRGHLRAQCRVTEVDAPAGGPLEAADASGGLGPGIAWTGVIDVAWPGTQALGPTETHENAVRLRTLEVFADRLVSCFYDRPVAAAPPQ